MNTSRLLVTGPTKLFFIDTPRGTKTSVEMKSPSLAKLAFYRKHNEYTINMKHSSRFSVKALRLQHENGHLAGRQKSYWGFARWYASMAKTSNRNGW